MLVFFFYGYGDHRDLHLLTHSFPTRLSSDLLSAYLARLISSSEYLGLRSLASRVAKKVSRRVYQSLGKAEEYTRGMVTGGTLFEELGFYSGGPIAGHNLDHLIRSEERR